MLIKREARRDQRAATVANSAAREVVLARPLIYIERQLTLDNPR